MSTPTKIKDIGQVSPSGSCCPSSPAGYGCHGPSTELLLGFGRGDPGFYETLWRPLLNTGFQVLSQPSAAMFLTGNLRAHTPLPWWRLEDEERNKVSKELFKYIHTLWLLWSWQRVLRFFLLSLFIICYDTLCSEQRTGPNMQDSETELNSKGSFIPGHAGNQNAKNLSKQILVNIS